jgi:aminopeptidase
MPTTEGPATNDERLERYAELVVGAGAGLRPGQELLIGAELDHAPLVRTIAGRAYRAGARYVDVLYSDPWVRRALVDAGPEETIGWTPPWMLDRLERVADADGAAILIIGGSNADAFDGADGDRLSRARFNDLDRAWLGAVMGRRLAWTIVAYPTERWAVEVFGEPDVDRLWDALAHALRLDEPDPARAWDARLEELDARVSELNERGFEALRYRGPETELEVGLIEGGRWLAGRESTAAGQVHVANLPTEEVFTSPHRLRAEGRVRSTLPLALRGQVIEGLELRISGGEIVEARAKRGEDVVRAELALDDGARRLGEVALVDASSRVGETGVVFKNTLLDENAASHIAWGQGVGWTVDHVAGDPAALGLNSSQVHTDFMVGAPEVEIDGIEPGGGAVPLLRDGIWQLSGG